MKVDIRGNLNESFNPAFNSHSRDLVIYGGAAAGKSYAIAQKCILKCVKYPNRKLVVIRRFTPSLRLTCFETIVKILATWKIPAAINRTELSILLSNKSQILCVPVVTSTGEPAERLKSLTDVTDMWFEEPTELSLDEYLQIRRRLRGGDKQGYPQRMYTFNPVDKSHWIYGFFFLRAIGDRQKYTYRDNRFLAKEEINDLLELKNIDENQYNVYALGEWGTFQNRIYNNFEVQEFDLDFSNIDDVIAGVDFGFAHPSAWIGVALKENTAYLFDEVYERKLTNPQLIERIQAKELEWHVKPPTYCDTAEPARIEEMDQEGIQVYEANKNVLEGIGVVQKHKLIIHPRCIKTIKEIQGYKRRMDRQGHVLEEPVKVNDHLLDALRYALVTHKRGLTQEVEFPFETIEYQDELDDGAF